MLVKLKIQPHCPLDLVKLSIYCDEYDLLFVHVFPELYVERALCLSELAHVEHC